MDNIHKEKISKSLKGHPQWNTGRTHFKKGVIPWNKDRGDIIRFIYTEMKGTVNADY